MHVEIKIDETHFFAVQILYLSTLGIMAIPLMPICQKFILNES